MSMHHYRLICRSLAKTRPATIGDDYKHWRECIESIADVFGMSDEHFDRAIFIHNCDAVFVMPELLPAV